MDIFPPVVDDPYVYGQIAAANSLSDVYAMGGRPKLAMNVLCMPEDLPQSVLSDVLQGGYSKCREADTIICGGHTIKDKEPKYGLCVSGFVHPDKILKNNGCQEGDLIIITKAVGTGILNTAMKADLLQPSTVKTLSESMAQLNRVAAEMLEGFTVNACTDVTGFGLIGHAYEMAHGSKDISIVLESQKVPILPEALEMAEMGIVPAGAYKNREWMGCSVQAGLRIPLALTDVMYDPQTSGGLMVSVPEKEAHKLIARMKDHLPTAEIIGYVDKLTKKSLIVK